MAIFSSVQNWMILGAVLVLGVVVGSMGPIAAAVAVGLAGLALILKRPILLLFGLVLYEPMESLLVSGLPQAVKSADELLVLVVFGMVLALDLYRNGMSRLLRHFLFVPTILFVLLSAASGVLNGVDAEITAMGIYVTIDYLLLALLLGCIVIRRAQLERVYMAIFFASAMVCLATFAQVLLGNPLVPGYDEIIHMPLVNLTRYRGPFEHPNDLANFMVFPIALSIGLLFHPVERIRHVRVWLLPLLVCFLLAMGRVAWISLFLAVLLFLLAYQRKRTLPVFLRLLPLLLVFSPLLYYGLASRISATLDRGDARILFAQMALPALQEHALVGVGPGRFGGVIANRYGSDVVFDTGIGARQRNYSLGTVDNFWLHMLVETGVLGTASFLLLLVAVLRRSHRELRRAAPGDPTSSLAAACFILTLYELFYNVSSPALEDNTLCAYYWLLVGALASVRDASVEVAPVSPS